MNKKVLVTGGAGFIGAHLVNDLIKKNYKVLIIDNLKTIGGIPYINPKSIFIKGDILNHKVLKKIENWKPQIIYHLAAQSGGESAYDNPKYDFMSNGFGTFLLSKLAKKIKVKHLIYTSSVAVYGTKKKIKKMTENTQINPDSIYGISKYTGEMFINQIFNKANTKTTIFRIFNTYGPGEDLNYLKKGMVSIYCSYVWRNKPIIVKGSLKRFRNYQYIDDVVNILIKTISNKKLNRNEVFNLTTGKVTKVRELLYLIQRTAKKKLTIVESKGTEGDSFGYDASNDYLKSKFNDVKFTSLEEGLKKYFDWIDKLPKVKNLKNYHPLLLINKIKKIKR